MKQYHLKSKSGFTLIELIIVIAIIGILTALIMPNFMAGRIRARDSAKKSDLRSFKQALQMYYNDYQSYPAATGSNTNIAGCGVNGTTACSGTFETTSTSYMKNLPTGYRYYEDNANDTYTLEITLENASDEDIAKSQSLCSCPLGSPGTCCTETTDYCICPD
jgi:type II secretion system protein G